MKIANICFRQRRSHEEQIQTIFRMHINSDLRCATRIAYRIVTSCKYIFASSI